MKGGDTLEISRRKALAGLGTLGVASTGAGLGTSAYFSDVETFGNNRMVAGELDLKVDWTEHYSDWSDDEAAGIDVSMTDPSVGPGFPSAAANKLLYVSDEQQFLANTAIESFPDDNDDGQQSAPQGFDICDYDADLGGVLSDPLRTGGDVSGGVTIGEEPNPQTTASGDPLINISDVKPGDFGEVTFSIHLCGNPGWVWLTGNLVDADENGTNEPEAADPDELDPTESDPSVLFANEGDEDSNGNTTQERVELLDAISAALWYDTGNDGTYGTSGETSEGDNYHQMGEAYIPLTGSLRNVLELLEGGMVPLDYTPGSGGSTGTGGGGGGGSSFDVCDDVGDAIDVISSADLGVTTARNIGCEELDGRLVSNGYVESGTEYVGTKFEVSGGSLPTGSFTAGNGGTITIHSVDVQAGTITLSTNFPVEVVSMKGGNQGELQYLFEDKGGTDPSNGPEEFGCILDEVTFNTPDNKNGNTAALSNVELCYDSDIPDPNGGGGGQETPGRECFPNSTTAYIGFEWWLPVDHANEIQGDSVSFDLGFYTEQCRHNDGTSPDPQGS